MSKFNTASFVASFPFLAEAVAPDFYSDLPKKNAHFLKRLNGGQGAAVKAAYDAFENGNLMLANHPDLLAECEKLLPNYGWKQDVLVVAYLTGRLGHIDRNGLCRTGGVTVSALDGDSHGPHTALKEKLHAVLVSGDTAAAKNEAQIWANRYENGKRKRNVKADAADAADVAASSSATAEEKQLAAAIMADSRIPGYFNAEGILTYGLPSPEMVDAPKVAELAASHEKLKADQDAIASAIGACKAQLKRKKLAAEKRTQLEMQVAELQAQLDKIALDLTRIENNPLFRKAA